MTHDISIESLVAHLPDEECHALASAFIDTFSKPLETGDDVELDDSIYPVFKLMDENPEMLWDLIIEVLKRKPGKRVLDMLAVGLLQTFLNERGESLVGLIEKQAETDPAFRTLLVNVRQESLNDATWQCIVAIRDNESNS